MKMEIGVRRINEPTVFPSTSPQTTVMTHNDPGLSRLESAPDFQITAGRYRRTSPFVSLIGRHVLCCSPWILPISQPQPSLEGLRVLEEGGLMFDSSSWPWKAEIVQLILALSCCEYGCFKWAGYSYSSSCPNTQPRETGSAVIPSDWRDEITAKINHTSSWLVMLINSSWLKPMNNRSILILVNHCRPGWKKLVNIQSVVRSFANLPHHNQLGLRYANTLFSPVWTWPVRLCRNVSPGIAFLSITSTVHALQGPSNAVHTQTCQPAI